MAIATMTITSSAVPTIVTYAPGAFFSQQKAGPRPRTTLLSLPYEILSLICESLCPHCIDAPRAPPSVSVDPDKSVCLETLPALAGAQLSCRTLCYITTPLLYHRVGVSSTRGLFRLARFLSQHHPRYARGVKELLIDDRLAAPRPLVSADQLTWLEREAARLGCGDLALRLWDPVAGRTCWADDTTLVSVLTDVFLSRAASLEELYLRNPYHLAQLGKYLSPAARLSELATLDVAFDEDPLDGGFDLGTIAPLLRRAHNIEYLRTFTCEDPLLRRGSRRNRQASHHGQPFALASYDQESRFNHDITAEDLMENAHRHDPLSSPNAALPSPLLSPGSASKMTMDKPWPQKPRIDKADDLMDNRHRHDPLSSPNAALPSSIMLPASPSPRDVTSLSPTTHIPNTAREHRADTHSSPIASLPSSNLLSVPGAAASKAGSISTFLSSRGSANSVSSLSTKSILTSLSNTLSKALNPGPSTVCPSSAASSSLRSLSLLSRSLTFLHLSVPDLRPADLCALARSCPSVETLRLSSAGPEPLTGGPDHARNCFAALLPLRGVLRHLDFDAAFAIARPEALVDKQADDEGVWAPYELSQFDALELLCVDATALDPFVDVRGAWGFPTGHGGMLARCLPPAVESVSIDRVPAGWARDMLRLAGAVGEGRFDMLTHFYYVPAEGDEKMTAGDEMVRAAFKTVGVKCRAGWVRGVSRWMWKFGTAS